jgi:CRISPR system Cascade subunit CasC
MTRFVQIHWLTSYPAALLNRDDAGLAKRMLFGGSMRIRISSQCLKRHWRTVEDDWSLAKITDLAEADYGKRSRVHLKKLVAEPLIKDEKLDAEAVVKATSLLKIRMFQEEGEVSSDIDSLDTEQAILLGAAETKYLKNIVRRIVKGDKELEDGLAVKPKKKSALTAAQKRLSKDLGENLGVLVNGTTLPRGLETALFGRMITSDLFSDRHAALHVAHAITVHEAETESDYFTVVDDITRESGSSGAAGLFDTELTSGIYYGYVAVDVDKLVENLGDNRELAGKVVEHLVHLVATVTPGAKLGSTAPYDYAELVLVEAGKRQPRKLSNAFRKAIAPQMDAATSALASYLAKVDAAHGNGETRRHMAVDAIKLCESQSRNRADLAAFARDTVAKGE